METNKPFKIEKIMVSPKRMIYIKLWPPSHHSNWGMTRSIIELQEVKISDDKQVKYGQPLRLPCDGSTALISDLISNFNVKGRELNDEFKNKDKKTSILESQRPEKSELEENFTLNLETLLLKEFKNTKLSKTKILTILNEKGYDIDKDSLLETLESLTAQKQISKQSAVHSTSGREYIIWNFHDNG